MLSRRPFKAVFLISGLLTQITPLQSIPTKSKLLIVPQQRSIHQKKLQTENSGLLTAYAFEATVLELLDQLYEQADYWQKKQALAKKTTWQQQTLAALDCLHNEIDYQAAQLAKLTEWISADEPARNKSTLIIPHDCQAYKQEALNRVAQYKVPSHLSRHWVKYTIGAVCTVGAVAYCHRNCDALSAVAKNAKNSARSFLYDHAYTPLRNSYDIIFGNNADAVGYHEKTTRELLKNYYTFNHRDKPEAEVEQIIDNCIKSLELPEDVRTHFVQQSESPAWNAILHRRLGGQFITLNQILLQLELLRAQKIYHGQKLNLELLVAIPTALVGYCSYRLAKGLYCYLAEKNYTPIKQTMLTIERLLNQFNNEKRAIADTAKGKIIYAVHKLSRMEHLIAIDQREIFFADLAELYATDFTIKQKLRTVDRMYRTYSFLNLRSAH